MEDALTPTDLKMDFVTDPSALSAAPVLPVLEEHGHDRNTSNLCSGNPERRLDGG